MTAQNRRHNALRSVEGVPKVNEILHVDADRPRHDIAQNHIGPLSLVQQKAPLFPQRYGQSTSTSATSPPAGRRTRTTRKLSSIRGWEEYKVMIERLYLQEQKNLDETMKVMEDTYGFSAKKRAYKEKMKQWGFEKNTSASDMKFILMKGEKRKRDEGKETMFYIRNRVIDKIKLERFKKRKFVRKTSDVSALAATPPHVRYCTPPLQEIPLPTTLQDSKTRTDYIARLPACSECDGYLYDIHYHCSNCENKSSDLCQSCIDNGKWCMNRNHSLLQRCINEAVVIVNKEISFSGATPQALPLAGSTPDFEEINLSHGSMHQGTETEQIQDSQRALEPVITFSNIPEAATEDPDEVMEEAFRCVAMNDYTEAKMLFRKACRAYEALSQPDSDAIDNVLIILRLAIQIHGKGIRIAELIHTLEPHIANYFFELQPNDEQFLQECVKLVLEFADGEDEDTQPDHEDHSLPLLGQLIIAHKTLQSSLNQESCDRLVGIADSYMIAHGPTEVESLYLRAVDSMHRLHELETAARWSLSFAFELQSNDMARKAGSFLLRAVTTYEELEELDGPTLANLLHKLLLQRNQFPREDHFVFSSNERFQNLLHRVHTLLDRSIAKIEVKHLKDDYYGLERTLTASVMLAEAYCQLGSFERAQVLLCRISNLDTLMIQDRGTPILLLLQYIRLSLQAPCLWTDEEREVTKAEIRKSHEAGVEHALSTVDMVSQVCATIRYEQERQWMSLDEILLGPMDGGNLAFPAWGGFEYSV